MVRKDLKMDSLQKNKSIWKIKFRHYPKIEKVYQFFKERWGFSNLANELYFDNVDDVIKFIYEFEYRTRKDWSGEAAAKERANKIVETLIKNEVFVNFSSKYMIYPCGTFDIQEIRINDLEMVLDSPLFEG